MSKKISIFIIGYLLLALTGCSSPTIELNGVIYDRSEFSNEALAWIDNYNSLSDDEKLGITYIPAELQDKVYLAEEKGIAVVSKLIGKVYNISENKITIGNNVNVYECVIPEGVSYDVNLGDTVEVEYSTYRKEEIEITPLSITVIQNGIDIVGSYVKMLENTWNLSEDVNSGVKNVILDLSNVINLTDFEKNIVSDYFQGITDLKITNMFIQGSVLNEKAMDDWYKTGLVLRIDEVIKTETGFEFTVFKIRDGYETVIVSNCEVKYVEGETVLSYIDEVEEEVVDNPDVVESSDESLEEDVVIEAPLEEIEKVEKVENTDVSDTSETLDSSDVSNISETEETIVENVEIE